MDSKRILSSWLRSRKARNSGKRKQLPPLIWLTDRHAIPDTARALRELPEGSWVIIRDYDHPFREAYVRGIAALCKQERRPFSVAGDGKLARAVKADGVHLGASSRRNGRRLRKKYPHWWITMPAHSPKEMRQASRFGADAALISPVFRTLTHEGRRPLGILQLRVLARKTGLPVYALGGVTYEALPRLKSVPLAGLAGIRGFVRRVTVPIVQQ